MATMYELTGEYRELLAMAGDPEIDPEAIADTLEAISGEIEVKAENTDTLCYYVRGAKDAWLAENAATTWGEATITKPVSVSAMHAWLKAHPDAFIAAIA